MARPKMPPTARQAVDFAPMPPARGFVRKAVMSAIDEKRLLPVEGDAAVTITWVEGSAGASHARVSEGVMAMYEALLDAGIVERDGRVRLTARQRMSVRGPHVELVVEGRPSKGPRRPRAREAMRARGSLL